MRAAATSLALQPAAVPMASGTPAARLRRARPVALRRRKHAALVGGVAQPLDEAGRFESLQQRREGAGVELEAIAELRDGDAVAFPQHQHDEILRIGEAERRQQRLVALGERERCGVEREAELRIECEQVRWRHPWTDR